MFIRNGFALLQERPTFSMKLSMSFMEFSLEPAKEESARGSEAPKAELQNDESATIH